MHILVYYKSSTFICNIIFHTVCTVKECRFIAETYRRGHNGTDSKSVYRYYTGTRVRIPPSPPENSIRKRICRLRIFRLCWLSYFSRCKMPHIVELFFHLQIRNSLLKAWLHNQGFAMFTYLPAFQIIHNLSIHSQSSFQKMVFILQYIFV